MSNKNDIDIVKFCSFRQALLNILQFYHAFAVVFIIWYPNFDHEIPRFTNVYTFQRLMHVSHAGMSADSRYGFVIAFTHNLFHGGHALPYCLLQNIR